MHEVATALYVSEGGGNNNIPLQKIRSELKLQVSSVGDLTFFLLNKQLPFQKTETASPEVTVVPVNLLA